MAPTKGGPSSLTLSSLLSMFGDSFRLTQTFSRSLKGHPTHPASAHAILFASSRRRSALFDCTCILNFRCHDHKGHPSNLEVLRQTMPSIDFVAHQIGSAAFCAALGRERFHSGEFHPGSASGELPPTSSNGRPHEAFCTLCAILFPLLKEIAHKGFFSGSSRSSA